MSALFYIMDDSRIFGAIQQSKRTKKKNIAKNQSQNQS